MSETGGGCAPELPQTLAATGAYANWLEARSEGGGAGNSFADRLARFAAAKSKSLAVAEWGWRREGPTCDWSKRRAEKQLGCASVLIFRHFIEGPQAGINRLVGGSSCDSVTCAFCAMRRAARTVQAYHPKVLSAWSEGYPRRRAFFGTFTVPNRDTLGEAWSHLESAIKSIGQRIRNHHRRGRGCFAELAGGVWSIETKRGRQSGAWHPHAHALLLVDGRFDFAEVQQAWSDAVGSNAWCHLQRLRSQELLERGELRPGPEFLDQLAADLCEVLKYPIKFGDAPHADVWAAARALIGRKRIRPFGCLYGVEVPKDLGDEPLDWSAWAWVQVVCRYLEGRYVHHETAPPLRS